MSWTRAMSSVVGNYYTNNQWPVVKVVLYSKNYVETNEVKDLRNKRSNRFYVLKSNRIVFNSKYECDFCKILSYDGKYLTISCFLFSFETKMADKNLKKNRIWNQFEMHKVQSTIISQSRHKFHSQCLSKRFIDNHDKN